MAGLRKFTNREDWFEIWYEDKESMIATMYRNIASDLAVGYSPLGQSITKQRDEVIAYQKEMQDQLEKFKTMEVNAINRWCFFDLLKRGAITY